MLYSYTGSVDRLRRHVVDMLAGKEVVVTAVSYAGTSSTNFTMAIHYRSSLRGVPLCRLKAGLQHTTYRPQQVVARNGGSEEDVPGLLTGLENPDASRRADAAEDLGRIGPPAKAALPALVRRLQDADPQVRIASAAAIASIDPKHPDVLPAALAEMKGAAEQRRMAADLLGDLGAVAVPALAGALKDADANVRWAAAESLGRIGPSAKAAVTDLAAVLADKEIRSIAADALGSIGKEAKPAVPALVRIVKEEKEPSLRMTAGVALARIDPPSAGPAAPIFAEALRHPDGRVRHDASIMLRELGPAGREATPILAELLRDKAQYARQIAANAVCYSRDPQAVPALVQALDDAEISVRSTAAMALGFVGPDATAAIPALQAKLKDADIGTRIVSAEALWKITKDEERTVPVLIEALRHKNTYMVGLSTGILARMGPAAKRGVPDLLALLRASDETQRRVAGQILKSIDPKAAADAGVK
jgi:HEAT repeat protein